MRKHLGRTQTKFKGVMTSFICQRDDVDSVDWLAGVSYCAILCLFLLPLRMFTKRFQLIVQLSIALLSFLSLLS